MKVYSLFKKNKKLSKCTLNPSIPCISVGKKIIYKTRSRTIIFFLVFDCNFGIDPNNITYHLTSIKNH